MPTLTTRPVWHSRTHLAVTALMLLGGVALAGMALAGRVHFGPRDAQSEEPRPEAEEKPSAPGGRYQIEKVDDVRQLLESAGKLRYFGEHLLEAWVFKFKGGYLQCHLEADVNGKPIVGEPLPNNWPSLLSQDDGVREDRAVAFEKQGYIILAAVPATITVDDAEEKYRPHLLGALAGAPHGPLHVLPSLHLDVTHPRPYRLFLSTGPLPKEQGAGFNVWCENALPVRELLVPRNLGEEGAYVGGGTNLEAGKEVLLLDRRRGQGQVRLKARFLGDGEVRDLASKK